MTLAREIGFDMKLPGKLNGKLIANLADIDRKTILQTGISAETLMENAGRAVADAILQDGGKQTHAVVLCGPGNNGGDGFVCARYLYQGGIAKVTVIYTGTRYQHETLKNLERIMALPVEVIDATKQLEIAKHRIPQADFIVDALFGSGLNRPVDDVVAQLIEATQAYQCISDSAVWAIDLPSGIDGATGQILGTATIADVTITLAVSKPGLYLQPGKSHAGQVEISDIGIPKALLEEDESPVRLITPNWVKSWLPARKPDSHKYNYGHLLVIAGSQRMPGAAALCSEAAMNAGTGLVTLAAPNTVFQQVMLIPEIMRLPLGDTAHFNQSTLEIVMTALDNGKYNTLLIGPGLGDHPDTVSAILKLLESLKAKSFPTIVDADALNALAKHPMTLNEHFILTPHVGEAARLLTTEKQNISNNLLESAKQLQTQYGAQIVLKSASTVIADSTGLLWISPTGNPGMATAGSGDVLSGIIGAQAAQCCAQEKPFERIAPLGVYLHGLAGDETARELTPYAMRASDITYHLPDAFRKLLHTNHDEEDEPA